MWRLCFAFAFRAPYLDLSYDVEMWVTADHFGDNPDSYIDGIIDGVEVFSVPVYYYTFPVFVHEGFDNVLVTHLYEFHPYAEALGIYKIRIDIDNPAG